MAILDLKPAEECRFDILSLGEVMLRFDPGEERIWTARTFKVWEGGGEYNVARSLSRCFGMRATLVSAIVDNPVGRLLESLILAGGVDMSHVLWRKYDGVGRKCRVGLNFTERGFGIRAPLGCSDRGHSAASQLKKGDVDWQHIFGKEGVRWMHTGGIFAGLSETTPDVILEAVKSARTYGTIISYDLNFRPSLWQDIGGRATAVEVNREIVRYVDVLLGNEEDFTAALGFQVEGVDEHLSELDPSSFKKMIRTVVGEYSNLKVVATTLRAVRSATLNDWSAIAYAQDKFAQARRYENLEIWDRVGGGDSFASGFIYGILAGKSLEEAVNYGAAHGALAMTTPGDISMATREEVEKVMRGGGARVVR